MKWIKKSLKAIGILLALALVLGSVFFVHVWYFKPFIIHVLNKFIV